MKTAWAIISKKLYLSSVKKLFSLSCAWKCQKFHVILSQVKMTLITACAIALWPAACSNDNGPGTSDNNPKPLESIAVTPASAVVTVGKTTSLSAAPAPADANPEEQPFVWTSNNTDVATVSGGQVNAQLRGVSPGAAEITVSGRLNRNISTTVPVTVSAGTYQNPVIGQSLPDPTIIKASNGWFYLYATEDTPNVPIWRSQNLVDWLFVSTCFTDASRPTFEPGGGLWAPDINYINGKYVLFYSMSVWGGEWTCGIGIAVADKPEGPFTDRGKLFRSNEINVQGSIDPFYIEDGGKKYLIWGSLRGVYGVELSDDGLALKPGAEKVQVAGTGFEAAYVHRRGNYYYLFLSRGSCCEGANSTYSLVVGRSESLFGPYIDKDGDPLLSAGNWAWVIQGNAYFVGPGHCSEIVTDDTGNDWMLYHGYVKNNADAGRQLFMSQIFWDGDDWPFVTGGSPAMEADAPYFRQ
jgi:arabinan endo-1,5-alpha-L-arabinosidase